MSTTSAAAARAVARPRTSARGLPGFESEPSELDPDHDGDDEEEGEEAEEAEEAEDDEPSSKSSSDPRERSKKGGPFCGCRA